MKEKVDLFNVSPAQLKLDILALRKAKEADLLPNNSIVSDLTTAVRNKLANADIFNEVQRDMGNSLSELERV